MRDILKHRLFWSHLLLLSATSCGLIDLASFNGINFDLPKRTYSVSTTDPRWHAPPPGGVPQLSCGAAGAVMDCCQPGAGVTVDCTRYPLECVDATCALKFPYEVVQKVDLVKEVPALAGAEGKVVSQITLKSIDYQIASTLNVPIPALDIFLANVAATTSSDPSARKIATIPEKPVGYSGSDSVPLDDAAQQVFAQFAGDFKTPFNIIAATQVVVKGGSATPQGKVDFTIGGKVEAKF